MRIAIIMDCKQQKPCFASVKEKLNMSVQRGDVLLDVVDPRQGYMSLEGCRYDLVLVLGCADMLDEFWWSCINAMHKECIVL